MSRTNFAAIVPAYWPDYSSLLLLYSTLVTQNIPLFLVDNTPQPSTHFLHLYPSVYYMPLFANTGIANALNTGFIAASAAGFNAFILFDQDSVLNPLSLSSVIANYNPTSSPVIIPRIIDSRTGIAFPVINIESSRVISIAPSSNAFTRCCISITSGTIISDRILNIVGLMNESFFIDEVDTEWFLRCYLYGIPVFVHPSYFLYHTIGDDLFSFLGLCFFSHRPIRIYYQTRNLLFLLRDHRLSLPLRLRLHLPSLFHRFVFLIATPFTSLAHIVFFFRGLYDGLVQRPTNVQF